MANHRILRRGTSNNWVTVFDEDLYVAVAGGTMTGNLTIPNGTLTGHAVNKGQMDTADATLNTAVGLRVLKAGDTMTGALTIPNGTLTGHAVNKGQLDAADAVLNTAIGLKVAKAGDTMTGNLTIPTGTAVGHAVTKAQMDAADGLRVAKTGDTMSGALSVTGAISATTTITATGNITGNRLYAGDWFRSSGNTGWYSTDYGGGVYMIDSTWLRSYQNKGIYTAGIIRGDGGFHKSGTGYMLTEDTDTDSGLYRWADGVVGLVGNGVGVIRTSAASNLQIGNMGVAVSGDPYTAFFSTGSGPTTFGTQPILLRNSGSGNVGIGFWVNGVAPILKAWSGAEAIEVRSSNDGGFVPIKASAFTLNSTLRSKIDVQPLDDDAVLDLARQSKQIKFRQKIRPQYVRTSERFNEVNVRWQEHGHSPLQPVHIGRDYITADHDCTLDTCDGTAENPCSITLNDTEAIGLAAEDVYEYFPEAVDLDADGLPQGIDTGQIAAAAFASVGALIRKVEALEARLAELEVA